MDTISCHRNKVVHSRYGVTVSVLAWQRDVAHSKYPPFGGIFYELVLVVADHFEVFSMRILSNGIVFGLFQFTIFSFFHYRSSEARFI